MTWFVFVIAYCVLSFSTVPVAGQCTVYNCAVSVSESEESLQVSLEEHDHRLETMNQNMCSALEKLEAAVNRTIARGQEELCQDLTEMYYNMSVNLERVSEKILERAECHEKQEQEEYLSAMNLSLAVMIVRNDELIQAVNENLMKVYQNLSSTLQTVYRSLDEKFQVMQVQFQSLSVTLQHVNRSLDEKFQVLQVQIQNPSSTLQNVNRSLDDNFQLIQAQLQDQSSTLLTANRNLDYIVQVMNGSVVGALRENDQKLQTMNETLSSSIDKINEKLNAIFNQLNENLQYLRCQDPCRNTSIVCDCSDIKANGYTTSGVYRIYVVDEGQRYYANASCDMTTTNDAWTVFQRRKDGSVDFYREWSEYANGFGNPSGEFWLGNNFLHLLTSKRRYRLRIDLEDFEGGKRYAEYSTFNISSSADKYRLRIGTYSGIAGDSLNYHNGQRFSTKDSDNDAYTLANLAVVYHAAWWYPNGHSSNLNGLYLRGP